MYYVRAWNARWTLRVVFTGRQPVPGMGKTHCCYRDVRVPMRVIPHVPVRSADPVQLGVIVVCSCVHTEHTRQTVKRAAKCQQRVARRA